MQEDAFVLRRPRSFGEVFNDTFRFLRLALPVMRPTLLRVILPLALVASTMMGGGIGTILGSVFAEASQLMTGSELGLGAWGVLGLVAFIGFLLYVGVLVYFCAFTFACMKAYDQFGSFDAITDEQLQKATWVRFWPLLGYAMLMGVAYFGLSLLGLIPCLGILIQYAGIAWIMGRWGMAPGAIGVDRVPVTDAFALSNRLSVANSAFWPTLGVVFLASMISNLLVMGFLFGPSVLGMMGLAFTGFDFNADGMLMGIFLGVVFGLMLCVSLLTYVIPVIASGMQYAQLNERTHHTTLWRDLDARRDELGLTDPSPAQA